MIVSFARVNHITYCPIYKSASTSWGITLMTLRGAWPPNSDINYVRSKMNKVFIKVPHEDGPKVDFYLVYLIELAKNLNFLLVLALLKVGYNFLSNEFW